MGDLLRYSRFIPAEVIVVAGIVHEGGRDSDVDMSVGWIA